MIQVKICGITTSEVLEVALSEGADFVGFIFYPPSKRFIELDSAAALRQKINGRAKVVAVVADEGDERLAQIVEQVQPDFIQAHGAESPARIAAIKKTFGLPVIKAISIHAPADAATPRNYPAADHFLFDAPPQKSVEKGGTGLPFDWSWLAQTEPLPQNWFLAGGLKEANLQQAIDLSGAAAVDVSSGVEDAKGNKDPQLVRRFLQKAKSL